MAHIIAMSYGPYYSNEGKIWPVNNLASGQSGQWTIWPVNNLAWPVNNGVYYTGFYDCVNII